MAIEQTTPDTTPLMPPALDPHGSLPELTDALPTAAAGVGRFLDPLIGSPAPASHAQTEIAFEAMNNAHACNLIAGIAGRGRQPIEVHALETVFQSENELLDLLDSAPLGLVSVEDEMTGQTAEVPLFECKEAARLREIMAVDGIVPLFSHDGKLVFALRTDTQTLQRLTEIVDKGVSGALEELSKLSPKLAADSSPWCVIPVNLKTYDTISAAMTSHDFRARRAIESCDAHFINSAGMADLFGEVPQLLPLSKGFAGTNPIEEVIRSMHFSPFIALESNDAQSPDRGAGGKSSSAPVRTDAVSVFDRPSETRNMQFFMDRLKQHGLLPLRIDRGDKHQPVAVLGFRAHERGTGQKRSWEGVVAEASRFAMTLASTFPDHFERGFSVRDMILTPIPDHYFEHLASHLGDPVARKNSLQIIDRSNGVLNYQQLLLHAVERGAQEVYLHLRRSGPSVRLGIGADVVEAPFSYSIDSFLRTVQALIPIMTNKTPNMNLPIEGQVRFVGATPAHFREWDRCFAQGETPPPLPGTEGNLNVYPRGLHEISLRLQYTPTITGPLLVVRIHRLQKAPPDLDKLGLRPEILKGVQRVLQENMGVMFLVAPTGAGKTTFLAAVMQAKNRPGTVIMTMEKPPEFEIDGIAQVDINEVMGRTNAVVLESALRSAPHIIMLGEVRNGDEADVALKAGLTGHLVLSTLHTNDAPEAYVRLLNMGVDPFFLSSAVNVIISQRLIRQFTPRPHCTTYQPDPSVVEPYDCRQELEELIGRPGAFTEPVIVNRARPGKAGVGEAYQGRVPVNEVIIRSTELQALLNRERWSMEDLITTLRQRKAGEVPFEPMVVGGIRWVLEGRTSLRALWDGEKVIPRSQFVTYADEIIEAVRAHQKQHTELH